MTPAFNTLLLTGAAGMLGRVLTPVLQPLARVLRLSDLPAPMAAVQAPAGTQVMPCDLADAAAVHAMMDGVQAVVHLGGVAVEGPFEPIMQANIRGVHNLYESARRHGTRRIVFASSNHVTGCYAQDRRTRPDEPARPDGNYGLSKLYGEGMASLYFDRYGIETVCLRIGTATANNRPPDRRALSSWLSHADLARLVIASLTTPEVGFVVAYGMSNNPRAWWDTQAAWDRIGYQPQDSAEVFAPEVQHIEQPEGPMRQLQGGAFMGVGPFDTPF